MFFCKCSRFVRITSRLITLIFFASMLPTRAMAWGNEGHTITGLIALALLTPRAQNNVMAVMEGRTIGDMATWPDDVKRASLPHKVCLVPGGPGCNPNYRPETVQWHFADLPNSGDGHFDPNADYCRNSRYGDCIVPAIEGFRDILKRSSNRAFAANSDEQKRKLNDALSFLVHFVGDIHQPLHCADNHDAGGNGVLVTWQQEPKYAWDDIWNLHSVWDEYLVDRNILTMPAGKQTYRLYAAALVNKLTAQERDYAQLKTSVLIAAQSETVSAWAEASHALAKSSSYALPSQKVKTSTRGFQKKGPNGNPLDIVVLDNDYFQKNMPIVERELILGGVRLARILKEIYDKNIQ